MHDHKILSVLPSPLPRDFRPQRLKSELNPDYLSVAKVFDLPFRSEILQLAILFTCPFTHSPIATSK